MITLENLFNNCDDSNDTDHITYHNSLYSVGYNTGNTLIIASLNSDNKLNLYADEWLYSINYYYPDNDYYKLLILFTNYLIYQKYNSNNIIQINEDVVSFIDSFSYGTVHGYTSIFSMLIKYINNFEKYKNLKIIVFVESQRGILNLIEYFCNIGKIDKNNIIYIDRHKIYNFKSITFIKNKNINYTIESLYDVNNFITECIINPDNSSLANLCIIKNDRSCNVTSDGVVKFENVVNFANKWNLTIVEPSGVNEIELINIINRCKFLIVTWGTAYMKNLPYISDNCTKILVLVIGNEFINQYNKNDEKQFYAIDKFKNTNIIYKIVDENLDFNPFE